MSQHISLDLIKSIADNDTDFVKEIIRNFLELVDDDLLPLNEALLGADEKNIAFFAHKLKGTFAFVGAERLIALAAAMERGAAYEELVEMNREINRLLPEVKAELQLILEDDTI